MKYLIAIMLGLSRIRNVTKTFYVGWIIKV